MNTSSSLLLSYKLTLVGLLLALQSFANTPTIEIITNTSDLVVECDGNGNQAELNAWLGSNGGATATSSCNPITWSNDFVSLSNDCGETGQALVTFIATDACGNSATSSGIFIIEDTESPVITTSAVDIYVECDGTGNFSELNAWLLQNGGATGVDNCSFVFWTNDYQSLTNFCGESGETIVTFTMTDDCGNESYTTASFSIEDNTSPFIDVSPSDLTVDCTDPLEQSQINNWLSNNGGAQGSDLCSTVVWSHDYTSGSQGCPTGGAVDVIFTVTDDCGNTSAISATINAIGMSQVDIVLNASDIVVECDGNGNQSALNAWLGSNGGAMATSSCNPITWSNDFVSLSDDCGETGQALVTFIATDACGNSATSSGVFIIEDTESPFITTSAVDIYVECDGAGNFSELNAWLLQNGGANGVDNCSFVFWTNDYQSINYFCGGSGETIVTFTMTDDCGNESYTTASFSIEDNTAPFIDVSPSDLTVDCTDPLEQSQINNWLSNNGGAQGSDLCSTVVWSHDYTSGSQGCPTGGAVDVIFTVTDECGNSATTSATINALGMSQVEIVVNASDIVAECDGNGNQSELNAWLSSYAGATATSSCNPITWSNDFVNVSDDCGESGQATVIFTATDDCGNSATTLASFTIEDTESPIFIINAYDIIVECDGNGNVGELNDWLSQNGGAIGQDNCSFVFWTNDYQSVTNFCGETGSTIVTFTITDDCGNQSYTTAGFSIEDNTSPFIDVDPSNLTVNCNDPSEQSLIDNWLSTNGGAQGSDLCGTVVWSHDYMTGSQDCPTGGAVDVIFTVTDECGNTATTSAIINALGMTQVEINVNASDIVVECDGNGNQSELNAWLSSNAGATATSSCNPITWSNDFVSLSDDCGETGFTVVTFTATDACGNSATTAAEFLINDTTSPTFDTNPESLNIECDEVDQQAIIDAWLANLGGATGSDYCSTVNGLSWSHDYSTGDENTDCGASGSVLVTFTVTDDCGNYSTASATIIITDTTPPTIDIDSVDEVVECDGIGNIQELNFWLLANGGASASDECSIVSWSNNYNNLSDDCGESGSMTVTFTATDDCGNETTTAATFAVEDTTEPYINTQSFDISVDCDDPNQQAIIDAWLADNGGAEASDNCSLVVTWTNNYIQGIQNFNCGLSGALNIIFTATDDCGNSASTQAEINMILSAGLTLSPASDLTVECNGNGNTNELNNWLATNGGASATTSSMCSPITWSNNFVDIDPICGAAGSSFVVFTATDACGNVETTEANFIIEDTTPPAIIISPSDLYLECSSSSNDIEILNWLNANGGAISTEDCGSTLWINDYFAGSQNTGCASTGSVLVTFSAIDECGNLSSAYAILSVFDTTPPVITAEAQDFIVECDGAGNLFELDEWLAINGGASSVDDCSSIQWSNNFVGLSEECGNSGSTSVEFIATDECGNTTATVASFEVIDTTIPIIVFAPYSLDLYCNDGTQQYEIDAWLADNGGAFANDQCSSDMVWSNDYIPGSLGEVCGAGGSTIVSFTVTDECGLSATAYGEIIMLDYNEPELIQPAQDSYAECDAALNMTQIQTWLDNQAGAAVYSECGGIIWANDYAGLFEECGGTGITTVNFVAIDNCQNIIITSASFFVEDYTPPTIDIPPVNLSIDCLSGNNTALINEWLAVFGNASASDLCGYVTWSHDYVSGTAGISCGLTQVIFTAVDECGNYTEVTAYINTTDSVAPEIITQAFDMYAECDGLGNMVDINGWLAINGGATATDDCSAMVWTNDYTGLSDDCGSTGFTNVTFTVTDDCGNSATTSAFFIVEDSNRPTLGLPASDLTLDCNPAINGFTINGWLLSSGGATASDLCGSVTWTNDYVPVSYNCGQSYTTLVNFVATDDCGLSKTTSATLTVNSSCISELFLTGVNDGDNSDGNNNAQNDASILINSNQYISPSGDVIYNAGQLIEMGPGFEVPVGAIFEAYIDGCIN